MDQVVPLTTACDELGYAGMYLSDHLFNPRELGSRYTYSERPDGAPGWVGGGPGWVGGGPPPAGSSTIPPL